MNVHTLTGRPEFTAGKFSGYVIWKLSDGFHLRWTLKGKKQLSFQGKIKCSDKVKIVRVHNQENAYKVNETQKNTIEWDTVLDDGIDGFDFLTPSDLEMELRIKNKIVKPKEIFLGAGMIHPENNPFSILQPVSELIMGEKVATEQQTKKPVEAKEDEIFLAKDKFDEELVSPEVFDPKETTKRIQFGENLHFEPAPLPVPAPEYQISKKVISTIKSENEIAEEIEMQKAKPLDIEIKTKERLEKSKADLEKDAERRIYDWLNQLLAYRDFTPKMESKEVISYGNLPESKPETFQEISNTELIHESDDMESRIYAWLTQLQQFRTFKSLER